VELNLVANGGHDGVWGKNKAIFTHIDGMDA
jgi:hypothetical protein